MALPPDFAQQVKASADIVRIIGETVRLKKAGSNWVGLCPFHQEKTPSFSVHAAKQYYYCFGCGAKGDVFRFVMETERVDFLEALKRVAQRAGIPIPADRPSLPATPEQRLRARLQQMHEIAAEFFRKQLQSSEAAPLRELMRQRGVKASTIDEFGLGYAPAGPSALATLLRKEGFSPEELEPSGLVIRRDAGGFLDRFRGRWIFPITSETGKVVAFGGRALGDEQPKYLNSPETPLYSKSRTLYNLSRSREAIRKANRAILVEGYMDAIAVHQAGVPNVVASCGTALTSWQARLLAKYANEVIVNYDPDSAGVAATDRSLQILLEEGLTVRVLRLTGGLDPDLFIREKGPDAYRAALEAAPPFFHYLVGRALELHGTASPEAKLGSVNFILPYLSRVQNTLIRSELMADIAQKLDIHGGALREAFQKAALAQQPVISAPPPAMASVPLAEAMLIRLLLEEPAARQEIPALLERSDLVDEMECGAIVAGLLRMIAAGAPPDLTALSDRLAPEQQRVLAEIAFDKEAGPVSCSEIKSYILALERRRLQRLRDAVQRRVLDAQKAQNHPLVVDLLREQKELDRKLRELL
ncbi:MAG TPA: DNA primase [Terriglobia bacterium]|nr:DNA primase [Terriglobia bacterium]